MQTKYIKFYFQMISNTLDHYDEPFYQTFSAVFVLLTAKPKVKRSQNKPSTSTPIPVEHASSNIRSIHEAQTIEQLLLKELHKIKKKTKNFKQQRA